MSLDDLLSRFSNLDCNTTGYKLHVLKLEFPVTSLLPDGYYPYLEPPKDIAYRCPPPEDRRVAGVLDLDFSVVLEANVADLTLNAAPHSVLLSAVADLPRLGGSSVLGVVSYFDETTNQVIYEYCLTTTTGNGFSSSRYFKLDSNESCLLFSLAAAHEWISLLQNLIARDSEQAYYHVRKRLTDQCGLATAFEEERRWETTWRESQHFSLQEALRDRLTSMVPESASVERNALRLRLPCGHVLDYPTTELAQMTEEECRSAQCPHCQVPILQASDIHEVEIANEAVKCAKQHRKNAHWTALDHVPDRHSRQFNGIEYTQSIVQHFESFFSGDGIQIRDNPEALVENLIQDALETVTNEDGVALSETSVPPAYIKFLYIWISRAVNFLCDRQCDVLKKRHLGIHRHGRELVYNPALWEPGSQSEAQLTRHVEEQGAGEDDIDVLSADMGEMDLDGTSSLYAELESMNITTEKTNFEEEL